MRKIKYIVVHCTATVQNASVEAIKRYWSHEKGWKNPGYHYIIKPSGEGVQLLDEEKVANGVKGYNSVSIHLSYIGGKDGEDTRTDEQKKALLNKVLELKNRYPKAIVQGHRDFPNVNKACPSFDAKIEYQYI